jgi:hypothetical protein
VPGWCVRVRSDRQYDLPVAPQALWDRLTAVGEYPTWWSWLRGFEADTLSQGERWRCTVQPPLPYRVRFDVHLDVVRPCERIEARVTGDVLGTASLVIDPHPDGSTARLQSDLAADNGALRLAARYLAPVVRYGHRWVLDTGARQFTERAL